MLFGKKKNSERKSKPQKTTGTNSGLRFEYDDVRWTVDVENEVTGLLVTGSKADEAGARIISALKTTGWKTIMLDALGEGMTSNATVDEKATDRRTAARALQSVSGDVLSLMKAAMSSSGSDVAGANGPILILNGFYPKSDAAETSSSDGQDKASALEAASKNAHDALSNAVGLDKAKEIEAVIDGNDDLDDAGKAAGKYAVAMYAASADKTVDSLPGIGDDGLGVAVSTVLDGYDGDDLKTWVMSLPRVALTLRTAIALLSATSEVDLGLGARDSGSRVVKQCLVVLANLLHGLDADDSETDEVYDLVTSMMRLSGTTGLRTLVIEPKPVFKDLHPLLPSVQARVIAGDLAAVDGWAAGYSPDSTVDYGVGDLTVVSPADYGLFNMSRGTARSASMPLDRTQIMMV